MPSVDGIQEHARTLPLERSQHCLTIHMEFGTDVGQGKARAPIDAGLAMDVDNPTSGLTQKGVQDVFKLREPVQNPMVWRIGCVQADIPIRRLGPKPRRTVFGSSTIDDVGDASRIDKGGGQKGAGSNKDTAMKVGGRLANVVWHRRQHYREGEPSLLMIARRDTPSCNTTPS